MEIQHATGSQAPSGTAPELIGRVAAVSGAQASVELQARTTGETATVGKFMGIDRRPCPDHRPDHRSRRAGPSRRSGDAAATWRGSTWSAKSPPNAAGKVQFQRGVTEYPNDRRRRAAARANASCGLVYGGADTDHAHIGDLQQNPAIGVHVDIDTLVSKHFAVLGTTGVGKSSGVAILLQQILETRPNLRIFLVDPHNEYGRCFGDKAQVLTPRNLRLPFWLFNFEETIDAFFGGRPGVDEEVEILAEVIPMAKVGLSAIQAPAPSAR